jgi:meso-butanediol dehydrogenase/(S,S)-butanediol dehydrogenase/diacetyl reductase
MTRRSALVTGGSRGIGKAIALRLATDGLDICVTDLPSAKEELAVVVREIAEIGVKALAIEMDVSNAEDVNLVFNRHAEYFGGIDVLVANAGIAITAPMIDTTQEDVVVD